MTTFNVENYTIRTLLQPSIHLYLLLSQIDEERRGTILTALAKEDVVTIRDVIKETIIENENGNLMLMLNARLFLSELKNSYAHIRDLHYHKEDNDAMVLMNIVSNVLEKHKIEDAGVIAKEVYNELFINNTKARTKKLEDSEESIRRNLKIQKEYAKKSVQK